MLMKSIRPNEFSVNPVEFGCGTWIFGLIVGGEEV